MNQNPLAALLGGQNPRSAPAFGANPTVANVINQRQKKRKMQEGVLKAKGGKVPGKNIALKHPPVGPNKVTRY